MVRPTVGRIAHYYPDLETYKNGSPCAAIVVKVHSEEMVNLTVFSTDGAPVSVTSVPFVQSSATPPERGHWATWPPMVLAGRLPSGMQPAREEVQEAARKGAAGP